MRRSGWLVPAGSLALWLLAVALPLTAALGLLFSVERSGAGGRPLTELLLTTTLWGLAVAGSAAVLGWIPGHLLGRWLRGRRSVVWTGLLVVPLCLPAYVIFWCWWQAWPIDTPLHRWAVEHQMMGVLRQGTLFVGLVSWSWPIVAWTVAAGATTRWQRMRELISIDRGTLRSQLRSHHEGPQRATEDEQEFKKEVPSPWFSVISVVNSVCSRLALALRNDRFGLLLGGFIVFLLTFNNTTCFDLAEVFSWPNELRAMEMLGAAPAEVVTAALPVLAINVAAVLVLWWMVCRRTVEPLSTTERSAGSAMAAHYIWTGGLLILTLMMPIWLLAANADEYFTQAGGVKHELQTFLQLYSEGLGNAAAAAAMAGVLAIVAAAGLAAMWDDHRRWVRRLADVQTIGWLFAAALPGTIIAVSMEAAYNRGELSGLIYRSPAVVVLGHLARFGFAGALIGRWMAWRQPRALQDMRRIDGALTLPTIAKTLWKPFAAAAAACGGIVFVLAISEIQVTALLRPPGFDIIASSVLNAMHYQQPQTVTFAIGCMLLIALLFGLMVGGYLLFQQMRIDRRAVQ